VCTKFGPHSLELGGRCFDEVVLHTFFTDETTARCVQTVKQAAERAGRNPDTVKVWSCFATVGDHIDEELRLMKQVGRLATYLQGYGELLVRTNGWARRCSSRSWPHRRADHGTAAGSQQSGRHPDTMRPCPSPLPIPSVASSMLGRT
jgi:alkanesulfonate monooxygenase SsuD/methylene tetrahydromethanopterin reductase-like flavin-dependent oxidoreductase (luciferase family)